MQALDAFGKIDILVSNAGINPHFGSILDVPEAVWDKLFAVNVTAGALLTRLVAPHIQKAGLASLPPSPLHSPRLSLVDWRGGSILYVSSIAGYAPMPVIARPIRPQLGQLCPIMEGVVRASWPMA